MKMWRLLGALFSGLLGAGFFIFAVDRQTGLVHAEGSSQDAWMDVYRSEGATVRYVAKSGSDSGNCANPGSPCLTIQYAVDQADAGDEIRIAAGTYNDMNSIGGHAQAVHINKSLILWGGFAESNWNVSAPEINPTIIDAQSSGRGIFMIGSNSTVVTGLQIINGDFEDPTDDERGGGLHIETSGVVISDTIIYNNDSGFVGGGISLFQSTAIVYNNSITDNSATPGAGGNAGGGISAAQSVLVAVGNEITGNYSGGIHCVVSFCDISYNILSENNAAEGAGIYLRDTDDPIIFANVFDGNMGEKGGGVYLEDCENAVVESNLFMDNRAFIPQPPITDDEGEGAGIFFTGGTTMVVNNTFSGGLAAFGGGIYAGGPATVSGNEIFSNTITDGGGGGIHAGFDVQIISNSIYSNTAASGGGILLAGQNNIVDGNVIWGNSAEDYGGGLLDHAPNTVMNNFILDNSAEYGGGAYIAGSDLSSSTWINNIIANNQVTTAGSGIYNYRSDSHFIHNTIASNTGGDGSGIFLNGGFVAPSQIMMTNTIIVSQTIGIYSESGTGQQTADLEATLWGGDGWENGVDVEGFGIVTTGTINVWGDPLFASPHTGDFHISSDSPAFDAGIVTAVTADIDGDSRPFWDGVDIGADEVLDFSLFQYHINLPIINRDE